MDPVIQTDLLTVYCGDVLTCSSALPNDSVHCIVTSPPYWGLRDYGVKGQLGLENTPEEYLHKIVLIFRELRRVLRKDGTLWLNMGDSYAGARCWGDPNNKSTLLGSRNNQEKAREARRAMTVSRRRDRIEIPRSDYRIIGLKPKDAVMMPARVALALQADGWYLRSDIIWNKPNPMPESVYDRPTKSHEYLFLLAKHRKYFYDHEAIKEASSPNTHSRLKQPGLMQQKGGFKQEAFGESMPGKKGRDRRPQQILQSMAAKAGVNPKARFPTGWASGTGRRHDELEGRYPRSKQNESFSAAVSGTIVSKRNKRSVWTITTKAYKGAHFATFPPKLVEPCVLAGTSARGCCPHCGAPWKRVIENGAPDEAWRKASGADVNGEYHGKATKDYEAAKAENAAAVKARILKGMVHKTTAGWIPTCKCPAHTPVPCTVLDSFGGSGTTAEVSNDRGRRAILFELNPEYIELIRKRCLDHQPLFAQAK